MCSPLLTRKTKYEFLAIFTASTKKIYLKGESPVYVPQTVQQYPCQSSPYDKRYHEDAAHLPTALKCLYVFILHSKPRCEGNSEGKKTFTGNGKIYTKSKQCYQWHIAEK